MRPRSELEDKLAVVEMEEREREETPPNFVQKQKNDRFKKHP